MCGYVENIVHTICSKLQNMGIVAKGRLAKSGNSGYISVDCGLLPSIRVSSHIKYKSACFEYNVITCIDEEFSIEWQSKLLTFYPCGDEYIEKLIKTYSVLKDERKCQMGIVKFNRMTPRKGLVYEKGILSKSESVIFIKLGDCVYENILLIRNGSSKIPEYVVK